MLPIVVLQAGATSLNAIDLTIVALYFLGVFAIGFYFIRRGKSTADYFLASRDATWWAIGASLFSANIGSEHFIGLAGISLVAYVFTKIAVALFAGALVLQAVLGWSMWKSAFALVVATGIYTV